MCAYVDLQNSCFLLKLIKHVHFETSWCSWLQIPLLYVPVISTLSAKAIFAQCDYNFSMHFIPSFGNSAIYFLLCTSVFACKRFLIAFFEESSIISSPPILDNLKELHKFLCTVKNHLNWFYKCEEVNLALEQILIHFKPDGLWLIRCCQQFCR